MTHSASPTAGVQPLQIQVGPYQMHAVPTGIFGLDGGAMFGTVPKVLWERTNPPDGQNRIAMEARALLLVSPDRKMLIDCGIGADFSEKYGEKLGPKFAEMFAIDRSQVSLERSLEKLNLRVSDITDVVLTHLHFDHAGGATAWRDGKLVPTFANAQYYVQKANLENAKNPNLRERASYYSANFEPLLEAGVLKILEGDQENIIPGVSVIVSNGHTVGQQMVKISDGRSTFLYCGDVIPTSTHVRLPWVMGYDLEPLKIIEEKRQVLTPAAEQGWYLFFEHDPYFDCAQVESLKGDFAVKARFMLT